MSKKNFRNGVQVIANIILLMAIVLSSAAPAFAEQTFFVVPADSLVGARSVPCSEQSVRLDVEVKHGKGKANEKADEIVRCHTIGIFENIQYGIRMEIRSIEKIEGGIQVIARAWQGTKQLGFGADSITEWERFIIYNPPILVTDPSGTIVRTWIEDGTGIVHERRLREDHQQAIIETLAHTMKVSGKTDMPIVLESVGNTTSTFYPDADPETTSVDGRTGRDVDPGVDWSVLRSGAGVFNSDTAATLVASLGTLSTTNKWATMQVAMALFDTSAIADTDTIDSGILSFFGSSKVDNFAQSVVVTLSNPASNTAIVNADYDDHVTDMTPEISASRITVADWSTTAYNDFALDADGTGNVSKTAITKFGYLFSGDFDNVEPTWVSSVGGNAQSHSADVAGTTNDPKLVVVHSVAVNNPPSLPTDLLAEGETNPIGITDATPEFSAIHHDLNVGDIATHYRIQVATSSDFSITHWDTDKTLLASSTAENHRIADISYAGPVLASTTIYYWRIKLWDDQADEGVWSAVTSIFFLACHRYHTPLRWDTRHLLHLRSCPRYPPALPIEHRNREAVAVVMKSSTASSLLGK